MTLAVFFFNSKHSPIFNYLNEYKYMVSYSICVFEIFRVSLHNLLQDKYNSLYFTHSHLCHFLHASVMFRKIIIFVKVSLSLSYHRNVIVARSVCIVCVPTVTVKLPINDNCLSRETSSTTKRMSGVNQSISLLVLQRSKGSTGEFATNFWELLTTRH